MSHRPRDWREELDEGDAPSEGRAGRPDSRIRTAAKERTVRGLAVVAEEPDPKIRRRKLARRSIETTLAGIVDLDERRARRDRQTVEDMFRDVCVAGRVSPESDRPEPDPPAAGASKAA